jgi:hypothetical protein
LVSGHNGGFGCGPQRNDGFDLPKVNFSAANATVRQVLSQAVATQANALWLVYLHPTQMIEEKSDWRFIALNPNYVGKWFTLICVASTSVYRCI